MNGNELNMGQSVGFTVKKKPVKCSSCGQLRTQEARCENCGSEIPYQEERIKHEKFNRFSS